MQTDEQKLIAMLDAHQPNWHINWADQQSLQQLVTGMTTEASMKTFWIRRIGNTVLHAAFAAGIVKGAE